MASPQQHPSILDTELSHRISAANYAYSRLTSRVWTSKFLSPNTRKQLFNALVIPHLLYGCQTWTLLHRHVQRLESAHHSLLRRLKRVVFTPHPKDQISINELHSRPPCTGPISHSLDKYRASFIGKMIRMPGGDTAEGIHPTRAALYTRMLSGVHRQAGGVIGSFWGNMEQLLRSERFTRAARDVFLKAKEYHDANPNNIPDHLIPLLSRRTVPDWSELAKHSHIWENICDQLGRD